MQCHILTKIKNEDPRKYAEAALFSSQYGAIYNLDTENLSILEKIAERYNVQYRLFLDDFFHIHISDQFNYRHVIEDIENGSLLIDALTIHNHIDSDEDIQCKQCKITA